MSRPRGRPPKIPYEERWRAVLDAGCEVFARRGFDGTSMGDVAERAGITRALLYEHVKTKSELFEAVVLRERQVLVGIVAERYEESAVLPARDRVRSRFHVVLDYAEAHPTAVRLLSRPESSALLHRSGRSTAPDALASQLASELGAAGRPNGRVSEILAAMIIGMVNELMAVGVRADWDREAVVDLLTDFTMAGFAGIPAHVLAQADRPPG